MTLPEVERPVAWGKEEDLSESAAEKKSRKARKWRSGYVDGTLKGKKRDRLEGGEDGEPSKKTKKEKKKKKKKNESKAGLTKKEQVRIGDGLNHPYVKQTLSCSLRTSQKGLGGNWAILKNKM